NDLFKKHYNLSPTSLRKQTSKNKKQDGEITLSIGYRPPYLWDEMLKFFAGRAIAGVETVKDDKYLRTVHLISSDGKDIYGWLKVGNNPAKNALDVTISENLLPVLPQVLARVRNMFDLHCDPHAIYESLSKMNDIKPNLCILGTRLPGCFDTFEMAVRAVLGQQITVKAASTLAARVVANYGRPVETGIEDLTHTFPTPKDVLTLDNIEESFGKLGVISARSRIILELANSLINKKINFDLYANPNDEMEKLLKIKGIGSWTAQYIAMRAMKWTDAFLETDVAIKKALEPLTTKEMLKIAENWRPWRSYANIGLWNSL
ncbi:MAG: adenosine deaminase, partial [Lactobacillus sp.]|nr:adenosine deaminase [Lactobacillus sp.]